MPKTVIDLTAPLAPVPEAAFLFADIAGFTAFTETEGDTRAAELAWRLRLGVEAQLGCDAHVVKALGDAVMVRIADPAEAATAGLRIVLRALPGAGDPPVRVGIACGRRSSATVTSTAPLSTSRHAWSRRLGPMRFSPAMDVARSRRAGAACSSRTAASTRSANAGPPRAAVRGSGGTAGRRRYPLRVARESPARQRRFTSDRDQQAGCRCPVLRASTPSDRG